MCSLIIVGVALYVLVLFMAAVINPRTFSVGDTSGAEFGDYRRGGIARQVKATKTMSFVCQYEYVYMLRLCCICYVFVCI